MKNGLLTLISISIILSLLACTTATSNQLEFVDQGLLEAVQDATNTDGDITEEDIDALTELDVSQRGITNLDGIESLTSLEELNLNGNDIEDLAPLLELENLHTLFVKNNSYVTDEIDSAYLTVLELLENDVFVEYEENVVQDGSGPRPQGVFYKVEEGSNTVYLLGSIHIGHEELYPLHETIESAFAESEYLAVELDITDIDEMAMTQYMMQHGMYTDGSTLESAIGEEAFSELIGHVSHYGVNGDMLNVFKPWVAADLLTNALAEEAGFDAELGVDLYFLEQAAGNMEIIPLETVEDQLDTMLVMSDETQAEDLAFTIENFDDGVQEIIELMGVWENGDLETLEEMRLVDEDKSEEYQDYMRAMTDDRDENMAEKIEEFLLTDNNETYFVVVGAMHLVGEKSIVGLLESSGYDVISGIQ